MTKRTVTLLLTMLVGMKGGGAPAEREWNLDLYGGAAWIQSSDLKVRGRDDTHAVNLTIFDISTHAGFTAGARFGYWLESVPFVGFGFDLDVFYMQIPVPSQTRGGTATLTGEFLDRPISVSVDGVASIPQVACRSWGSLPSSASAGP